MKKLYSLIKKFPYFAIMLLAIAIYLPQAIRDTAETDKKAIVTAMSVDSAENNQVEVSVVVLTPIENQSFKEIDAIVSAVAPTFGNALAKINLRIGRTVGLAHTDMIVIGEGLAEKNLANILNHILKNTDIANNTILIFSDKNAKDLLNASQELYSKSGLKLQDITSFNDSFLSCSDTTLSTFFKSYFSYSGASVIGQVKLTESTNEGLLVSGETGSGGGSPTGTPSSGEANPTSGNQNNSNSKQTIENDGSGVLLKNGKLVKRLSPTENIGINWLTKGSNLGAIAIDNVSSNGLDNAKLLYAIRRKSVIRHTSFENNVPVLTVNMNLTLELQEIWQNNENIIAFEELKSFLNDEVRSQISYKIKKEVADSFQMLKQNKCDVLGFYEMFYKNNKKEFKKFLKTLTDETDYFSKINIKLSVNCIEYL